MTKYHVEGILELTRFRRGNTGGGSGDWQVGASADDGWSNDAPTFNAGGSLNIGILTGDVYDSWARFLNITIPQGATIDVATIIYTEKADRDGVDTKSNLYFNDIDDAVVPTDQAEHAALTRTTAFTAYDDFDLTFNEVSSPIDVKTAVQEVVNRGSWANGNSLMLLWDDDGSVGADKRYIPFGWDNDPVEAVKLHVEWST